MLTEGVRYVHADRPSMPFTVTQTGYYSAYVTRRGHFVVQRHDVAKPIVRC